MFKLNFVYFSVRFWVNYRTALPNNILPFFSVRLVPSFRLSSANLQLTDRELSISFGAYWANSLNVAFPLGKIDSLRTESGMSEREKCRREKKTWIVFWVLYRHAIYTQMRDSPLLLWMRALFYHFAKRSSYFSLLAVPVLFYHARTHLAYILNSGMNLPSRKQRELLFSRSRRSFSLSAIVSSWRFNLFTFFHIFL